MSTSTIYAINVINMILGSVGLFILFQRTWRRSLEYPREVYLLLVMLEGFIIALLATSAELMIVADANDWIVGVAALIMFVKIAMLWVLWTTRNTLYRTSDRHVPGPDAGRNADEMDVDRNFESHPQEGS